MERDAGRPTRPDAAGGTAVLDGPPETAPRAKRDAFGNRIRPGSTPATGRPQPPTGSPSKDRPRKGRFEVTRAPDVASGKGIGRVVTLLALGLLVVIAVQGGRAFINREDPHYVAAREMVDAYEVGRPPASRNYGHSVYQSALAELALVDPGSSSSEQALAMQQDLERRIAEFRSRRETVVERQAERRQARDDRHAAIVEARNRTVILPESAYEECKEEGEHTHAEGR